MVPQNGAPPAGTEPCFYRRFDGGLRDAILAFQPAWYPTEMPNAVSRVAKPGSFFSFYSRFTPKKYVTAVFFCGQNLSLLQFLKAVTIFTVTCLAWAE